MSYNLSIVGGNVTGMLGFTQSVNTHIMNGWFGILLLVGLSLTVFLNFYFSTKEIKSSLLATTFISFGLSVLLRAMDLVPNKVLFITLIAAGLTIAFTWKE